MKVGVLALQGAFREHQKVLAACGAESVQVRKPEQLEDISALVIPGGESTTIGKLLLEFNLFEPLVKLGQGGLPVFGTCAGMILLAREIAGSGQPRLGLMDISVERNAFGRQVESFEADLDIPVLGEEPFRAVFIRAPYIIEAGGGVEVLARFGEKIVMARQGRCLAAAFHPELTGDLRIHRYFLEKCVRAGQNCKG
ncbi:predicted glutamine amidotransferase [Pelotomaculum thermopropionicum SI]|uniref:Pyridoxal 5'-phosphate synthase subunit PdxT n=1 Tax=Pelotomaculum thermopropionicum (strain DSM 13744 / JCM 10971 / SI) TaxID=370438 RepID=PDXT_PELTS|nr:RecName: Full=Pyridoxal 5'-phosphate synthase subunit PdxT; AltName: Full=Pdx2; AltName: Full=Pyridoxal 5'-phosphate synthase glutaminase subunit [Pelotomaculum thermopropionicum SI]BAF58191.1 predicted glutamine amidotransferase [Pelotomaculum thermopropionicum SI]